MSRKQEGAERGEDGKEIWDMGSSLYDSYELASLCQILDRHIGTDQPSSHGEPPQPQEGLAGAPSASLPAERRSWEVVVFRGPHRRGRGGRKMTLRALFRAAACWSIRPRKAHGAHGCACVGAASSGAIEPVVSPGKL